MTDTNAKHLADHAAAVGSYTVADFCRRHQISRAKFYLDMKAGKAPRVFKCGSLTRISVAAEADWIIAREAETALAQQP